MDLDVVLWQSPDGRYKIVRDYSSVGSGGLAPTDSELCRRDYPFWSNGRFTYNYPELWPDMVRSKLIDIQLENE